MTAASEAEAASSARWIDGSIWVLIWWFEHELAAGVAISSDKNGKPIHMGHRAGYPIVPLPFYTTILADALSVWPDEERPQTWFGTAWECCIAGLRARKARIAERRKQKELTQTA